MASNKIFRFIEFLVGQCKNFFCMRDFVSFLFGYLIITLGIILDDLFHEIPIRILVVDPAFYLFPTLIGILSMLFIKILEFYVTNLKLLTKKYKFTQMYLRTLIDTIPAPVFYKNLKGVYLDCNDEFSKTILGIPKEAIFGKTLFDFLDLVPEDLIKNYDKSDKLLIETNTAHVYDSKVKIASGEVKYYTFYKSIVYDQNNIKQGIVGVMLDISDKIKMNELLEKKATTDPLTKLKNRRCFDEILLREFKTYDRYKIPFSLMLIDIDDFKSYNDIYGHVEGDNVLVEVGKIIFSNLRELDLAFRYGGEEFAIIFPNTDLNSAKSIGERLVKSIENRTEKLVKKGFLKKKVTISAGIKEYNKEKNIYDFVDRVDKKLYLAKKKGKNRVEY